MVNTFVDQPMRNVDHARDHEYSIQLNRWLLKPIGAWPVFVERTRTQKALTKVLNVVCHSLIIFTFAPCLLFVLLEETSVQTRMKAVGPMSHWIMGELNYCCLTMRSKDILRCVRQIEHDWRTIAFCMNLGVYSYSIITGFRKLVFHVGNESYSMYRLPCPFYTKLMNVQFSPTNEIVFALQLLSLSIVNLVTIGACGLAAILAMHACGQLSVIMSWMDDLAGPGEEDQKIVKKKLALIVEHHLRTLSFVWCIERIMNLICLIELVGCTLNICMLEYYIVTEKSKDTMVAYAIVYASMAFNIFIFCYIGELLTQQCKKVGEKAYTIQWYRFPRENALSLLMIITRSSIVIKITAGKLVQISIVTFGEVLKTSFAYFNMLRTIAT